MALAPCKLERGWRPSMVEHLSGTSTPDSGSRALLRSWPRATRLLARPFPRSWRVVPAHPGWGQADVGWKAAEALLQTHEVQETTAAGLPKRVPKTNLVPGSAAPRSPQTPRRKPAAPRSADAVRGRMANFQQGVHRGRHAKAEPVSTELPRSNPSRPEEQE